MVKLLNMNIRGNTSGSLFDICAISSWSVFMNFLFSVSVLLTFLLLPINNPFRFSVMFHGLVPYRIAFAMAVLSGGVILLMRSIQKGSPIQRNVGSPVLKQIGRGLLLLGGIYFLAFLLSPIPFEGARIFLSWLVVCIFTWLIFLLPTNSILYLFRDISLIRYFTSIFAIGGGVCVIYNVVSWWNHSNGAYPFNTFLWDTQFANYKAMYDSNLMSNYLAITALVSLYLSVSARAVSEKVFYFFLAVIEVWVCFYSFSRTGMGTLFFGVMIFIFFAGIKKKWWPAIYGVILLSIGCLAICYSLLMARPAQFAVQGASQAESVKSGIYKHRSTLVHFKFLESQMAIVRSHPLGVGFGGFTEAFKATKYYAEINRYQDFSDVPYISPHSTWGHVLAETGILGFAAYAYVMSLILWGLFVKWRNAPPESSYLFAALLGGFVGLQLSAVFQYFRQEWFWLYLCLTLYAFRFDTSSTSVTTTTVSP